MEARLTKADDMDQQGQQPDNSLGGQQTGVEGGESLESGASSNTPGQVISTPGSSPGVSPSSGNQPPGDKKPKFRGLSDLWHKVNIYFLLFVLLLVVAIIIVAVILLRSNTDSSSNNNSTISSQNLSTSTLQELAKNSVTVGGPKEVLNVESNTIFSGTVLVRGDLQVAGTIKAGGSLSLPGISVSGSSSFGQVQAKTLAISGNTTMEGSLTLNNSLSVNGNGTFSGIITAGTLRTGTLELTSSLTLDSHVTAGGPIPGRSNGNALGTGGTSSVSGSDTAGSISIHTGSNTAGGCFVTINFVKAYTATPHVIVTPVGSAAAGLNYYVDRTTKSMSVCTTNTAPTGSSFGFDYIVFD
jgi:cytoskeletal protein CcmA (bactofilin family)